MVYSGLLSIVKNEEELVAILAHECGHIFCRHVLYHSMASMLAAGAMSGSVFAGGAGAILGIVLTKPISEALAYWSRRSEYSADRAALVYLGDSAPMVGALTRLVGGPADITGNINVEERAAQAECFLKDENKWHKIFLGSGIDNFIFHSPFDRF